MTTFSMQESGNYKHSERRGSECAVPLNLREFLNEDQRQTLRKMESFGWHLAFIRRPLFQEPVAIVANSEDSEFSVLEKDGSINNEPDVFLRH
ncbi:MAG: hypothetical protein ACI93R_000075 [Flavobacteriales bacterium]|jgi:hypothetical protein